MSLAELQGGGHSVVHHPLFALGLTLLAFQLALWLYRRSGWLLLQPVMVAMLLVVAALFACGLDYPSYREGAAPIALLLGPATVALAVPLYSNLRRIRLLLWPVLLTVMLGGTLTVLLTLLIAQALGASVPVLASLSSKSVTMPIAMLVTEQLEGIVPLAAVAVMLTGVIGTALGPLLLGWAKVDHPAARGLSYGINAHAIGTARALEEGEECAAFAALGMSLLGVMTAVVLPLAANWLFL
ncbi:MAG: LrgB family protein [Pseudomonas sp.]|uniref:LrgB family protein n=1 Tax=Pseudomonas sp. TaxID=306 RepID=UPI00299EEC5B|nr:LrgB family protein [Pseudomonas sp.]MDX1725717.1 LrgB family protein [Pseudomonas sp.]